MGGRGWREAQDGGDVCTHGADSLRYTQKLTQYCEATIPQLKKNPGNRKGEGLLVLDQDEISHFSIYLSLRTAKIPAL